MQAGNSGRHWAAALLAIRNWEESLRLGPSPAYLKGMHLLCLRNITHGGHPDRWPGWSDKMKTSRFIKKTASAVVFSVLQTGLHSCIYAKYLFLYHISFGLARQRGSNKLEHIEQGNKMQKFYIAAPSAWENRWDLGSSNDRETHWAALIPLKWFLEEQFFLS